MKTHKLNTVVASPLQKLVIYKILFAIIWMIIYATLGAMLEHTQIITSGAWFSLYGALMASFLIAGLHR